MSHELKIGLLVTVCIAVTVWGYKFMKGKNILKASNYYYVEYENINELAATSPVLIKGLRVGIVSHVELSDDMQSIIATLEIDKGIKIPHTTVAVIQSTSIMGGKVVVLEFDAPCAGEACATKGDYLQGDVKGIFETMLGDSDIEEYMVKIKKGVGEIFSTVNDSLTSPHADSGIAKSFQDLQKILQHLAGLTEQLNNSFASYDKNIDGSLKNIHTLSSTLADNAQKIESSIDNIEQISRSFAENDIGTKASETLTDAGDVVKDLQAAISQAKASFTSLNNMIKDLEAGKGTLGKLAKEEDLYNNLTMTLQNLELLLQDLRLNPKRYVNVSVFGKKQKEYEVPEDDPAFEEQ